MKKGQKQTQYGKEFHDCVRQLRAERKTRSEIAKAHRRDTQDTQGDPHTQASHTQGDGGMCYCIYLTIEIGTPVTLDICLILAPGI